MRVFMITSEWPVTSSSTSVFIARQVEFLRRAGVEVEVFHFRGEKRLRNYIRAWHGARRRLSLGSYDLVHAQFGQSALMALPKRLPLVVTFRGGDLSGDIDKDGRLMFPSRIHRALSRWVVAGRADQVVVVSEHLARQIPGRPYHVIPSGLDLDLFRPMPLEEARRRLGLPIGKPLVLFAAKPSEPCKRYALAEAAMTRLSQRLEAELVVASGVPHVLMPCYMSACDALLVTSIIEGSPNVVKEALACNLPVVSVNVGDVQQRIGPVEGCVLCEDDSPETIASGLERILLAGRRVDGRRAVVDLDECAMAERTIAVYREAIASWARATRGRGGPCPSDELHHREGGHSPVASR